MLEEENTLSQDDLRGFNYRKEISFNIKRRCNNITKGFCVNSLNKTYYREKL